MKSVECEPLHLESHTGFLSALDQVVIGHQKNVAQPGASATGPSSSVPSAAIGRLVGFTDEGVPLVELPEDVWVGSVAARATAARTTVALAPAQIGSEVVLCFASGDSRQPIILGLLVAPSPSVPQEAPQLEAPAQVELNGQRLELTAQDELVLRCGKSSITLTNAGKVLIRGEYLLSRSSGVNRIKGGSVQIN